jgi:signal transduction histidine kinase
MNGVSLNIVDFSDFTFECRASQIEQVLLNLLSNSIDSISDLPEKWIKIEILPQKDSFTLRFTDSGKGIPMQIADRIMEPFFTTKAVGKGTGLGLSISKGLIESHNGQLLYNNKSKNTEFTIQLPIKQSSSNSSKKVS